MSAFYLRGEKIPANEVTWGMMGDPTFSVVREEDPGVHLGPVIQAQATLAPLTILDLLEAREPIKNRFFSAVTGQYRKHMKKRR